MKMEPSKKINIILLPALLNSDRIYNNIRTQDFHKLRSFTIRMYTPFIVLFGTVKIDATLDSTPGPRT